MPRQVSSATTVENLKKEAKRWMKALRASDADAQERLRRACPNAPAAPALRDVQQALAVEYGCESWIDLKEKASALAAGRDLTPRAAALQALLRAADRGDTADVTAALDEYPDLLNERGELEGHTGLRTALHFGVHHEPIVKLLLDRGADPNIRDQGDNAFPLHFVAETGELPIITLLVEHGAQTTAGEVDDHELDIIGWATCFGLGQPDRAVVDYLVAHGATHTILSAVATGEVDIIRQHVTRSKTALDRRMDRTNHRRTPLHLAVVKKQAASLMTLLDLGADTEAEDAAGLTALDQAALDDDRALAQILIDRGARVRLPAAIALQRVDEIEPLLRAEPHSLKPGGKWATFIIRASERGSASVVETLVRFGADVNMRDDTQTSVDQTTGYTALHAAAFQGNVAAITALLAAGADPTIRDSKYNSTPAGWADYARKPECRDLILASDKIDIFDAIDFDRVSQMPAILQRDREALNRPLGKYGVNDPRAAHLTPLAYATFNNKVEAVRVLRQHGADFVLAGHVPATQPERVAEFLRMACLDWRVGGPQRLAVTHAAGRLLARHPEIVRANIYTAVACGDVEEVQRILAERPSEAVEVGGPRAWPPLLYLCSTRLPDPGPWSANAVEIAHVLLDHDADPNVYYEGGNETIHYTALTCVAGRGEEQATVHPQARPLAALLLERGAEPYDEQFFYNAFAGHASQRHLAEDDFIWLLDLMYEHSLRRVREADWKDPDWKQINMGGYGSGAWYLLFNALRSNRLALAEWCLAHGANPNPPRATDRRTPSGTLYDQAVRSGLTEFAELLARYGASRTAPATDPFEEFQAACMRLDRARAEALLSEHPEFLTNPTPLFTAAEHDLAPVAQLLLDLGMSPDTPNAAGGKARALHLAAYNDSRRVATLLVERGATVDPRDDMHDATPIYWALFGRKPGMIDLLTPLSRDVWSLAAAGKVDRLREVLAAEPHLAKGGGQDHALLFYLPDAERAAVEVTRLLLAAGADPTVVRKDGVTPEQAARARGLDAAADLMRSASPSSS